MRTVVNRAGAAPVVTYSGDLASNKADRIAQIKVTARERILAIAPEWRQANLTARAAELALAGGPKTPSEVAEVAAGQTVWNAVKAVRAASDVAEAAVNAATTPEAVWAVAF